MYKAIGFNESLGWSHTDNTIDNSDTYELNLKGNGYELDGEETKFDSTKKTILIKKDDGSLQENELTILKTLHGPVIKKTKDKVIAIRLVGLDRANMFLQWWRMLNSTNFDEFESALKMIWPPRPPSPPSGPPRGIYFSLLKLTAPLPPFPAKRLTSVKSINKI